MGLGVVAAVVQVEPSDIEPATVEHGDLLVVRGRPELRQKHPAPETGLAAQGHAADVGRFRQELLQRIRLHPVQLAHHPPEPSERKRAQHQSRQKADPGAVPGDSEMHIGAVAAGLSRHSHMATCAPALAMQRRRADRIEIGDGKMESHAAVEGMHDQVKPGCSDFAGLGRLQPGARGRKCGKRREFPDLPPGIPAQTLDMPRSPSPAA